MASSLANVQSSGYGKQTKKKNNIEFPTSPQPKSILRPKQWNEEVEEAYRFQVAGYRDEAEYKYISKENEIVRWPENGFVKKLQRRDGCFYYFNRKRECTEKDVNQTKIYAY